MPPRNHDRSMSHFYDYSSKHQINSRILTFSVGIEMKNWLEIDQLKSCFAIRTQIKPPVPCTINKQSLSCFENFAEKTCTRVTF